MSKLYFPKHIVANFGNLIFFWSNPHPQAVVCLSWTNYNYNIISKNPAFPIKSDPGSPQYFLHKLLGFCSHNLEWKDNFCNLFKHDPVVVFFTVKETDQLSQFIVVYWTHPGAVYKKNSNFCYFSNKCPLPENRLGDITYSSCGRKSHISDFSLE